MIRQLEQIYYLLAYELEIPFSGKLPDAASQAARVIHHTVISAITETPEASAQSINKQSQKKADYADDDDFADEYFTTIKDPKD